MQNLAEVLEKHRFSEKVQFVSLVEKHYQIALHGPRAAEILRQIASGFSELPPLGSTPAKIGAADVLIWRDDPCGVPGYYIVVPMHAAGKLWMEIISAFSSGEIGKRPVRPAGWAVFNTTRIEAGRAMFGIDFDDSVLPAETGQLPRAVSFTKGCYLGQEIVARMHARGQVARQIVGIKMQEDALPVAGRADHGRSAEPGRRHHQQHHIPNPFQRGDRPGDGQIRRRQAGNDLADCRGGSDSAGHTMLLLAVGGMTQVIIELELTQYFGNGGPGK